MNTEIEWVNTDPEGDRERSRGTVEDAIIGQETMIKEHEDFHMDAENTREKINKAIMQGYFRDNIMGENVPFRLHPTLESGGAIPSPVDLGPVRST
jgi:hypothetical protein